MTLSEERRNVFLVKTTVKSKTGKPGTAYGTGFLLPARRRDIRVLLTNHHCVHKFEFEGDTFEVLKVEVLDVAGNCYLVESGLQHGFGEALRPKRHVPGSDNAEAPADLAVLFIRKNNVNSVRAFDLLPEGLRLIEEDQTGWNVVGQVHMWDLSSEDPICKDLETGIVTNSDNMDHHIQILCEDGNSGAPVVDHDGNVIGVFRQSGPVGLPQDDVVKKLKAGDVVPYTKRDVQGLAVRGDLAHKFVTKCLDEMIDASTGCPRPAPATPPPPPPPSLSPPSYQFHMTVPPFVGTGSGIVDGPFKPHK